MKTTPEKIVEWKALAEAATPGPWEYSKKYGEVGYRSTEDDQSFGMLCPVLDVHCDANGEFVAAAREAIPALIADLEDERRRSSISEAFAKELSSELISTRKQLAEAQAQMQNVNDCFDAATSEGLFERLAEAGHTPRDGSLADLVQRRLLFAPKTEPHLALQAAIAEAIEPYRKDAERYQIVRAAMFDEHLMGLICMHDEELETPDEFDRVVSAAIAAKGGSDEQTT